MMWAENIKVTNEDCAELMARYPDNYFDLAIVDPPYFDGPQKPGYYNGTKQVCDIGDYKTLAESWEIVDELYINECIRVSKNQIIWGVNYFPVSLPGGRIIWIKGDQGSPFSMADIAYQSFYKRIDLFKYTWSGFWQERGRDREQRIHPTQKPTNLYEWLLVNYAKEGDKILDTHLGSGSHAIACHNLGFELTACEIDEDYYNAAHKRFKTVTSQLRLNI